MRSQKIINKAPRPPKGQSAARGFSGGSAGFIPPPKFPVKVKKPAVDPVVPEKPDMEDPA